MQKYITHPGRELAIRIFDMRSTLSEFAEEVRIPLIIIYEITSEQRGITEDIASVLSKIFNTSPEYWLDMQQVYDLYQKQKKDITM